MPFSRVYILLFAGTGCAPATVWPGPTNTPWVSAQHTKKLWTPKLMPGMPGYTETEALKGLHHSIVSKVRKSLASGKPSKENFQYLRRHPFNDQPGLLKAMLENSHVSVISRA